MSTSKSATFQPSSNSQDWPQGHWFEMALDAMLVTDEKGWLLDANPAACQFFDLERHQLLSRPFSQICRPQSTHLASPTDWPQADEIGPAIVQGEMPLLLWNGARRVVTYRVAVRGQPRCQLWILQDITAQKQAEDQCQQLQQQLERQDAQRSQEISQMEQDLALNEARLRAIFNQAAIGINQAAPNGYFIQANQTYCQMLGYSETELLTLRFQDVEHPDDMPATEAALQRLYGGEQSSITLEKRYIRKDGTVIWTNTVLSILRDENGQPISDIAIVEDITRRKQVEQVLHDERNLFISGPTVVFKWSPDSGWPILYVSPNVEAQLGYAPATLMTRTVTFRQLIHPDDCDRIASEVADYTATKTQYCAQEYRLRHANGEYRWFDDFTHVIYDAQGEVVQLLGYVQDITDRKQIELTLQQNEATKQAMLEAIPDLLLRINRQGIRHDFISGGEVNVCGMVDSQRPQSIYDILPKALADQRLHFLAQALDTGERQQYEHTITVGGKQHYEETRIVPLDHDEALVMVRDITDRVRAEVKLQELTQQLQQAQQMAQLGNWWFDLKTGELYWSAEIFRLLGVDQSETPFKLEDRPELVHPDDLPRWQAHLQTVQQQGTPHEMDMRVIWPAGEIRYVHVHTYANRQHDQPLNLDEPYLRLFGTFLDVTDRKRAAIRQEELLQQLQQANQELNRLAMVDGLTQVANRRRFDQVLAQEWDRAKRDRTFLTLILCDIDFFKPYNDNYGHPAGDRCLRQVADILSQMTQRAGDLVARYGGEEFGLVLPKTQIHGAIAVAERIQAAIAAAHLPHDFSKISDQITLSLGIVCCIPKDEHSPCQLIDWADAALYHAKAKGRNIYHLGTTAMKTISVPALNPASGSPGTG